MLVLGAMGSCWDARLCLLVKDKEFAVLTKGTEATDFDRTVDVKGSGPWSG